MMLFAVEKNLAWLLNWVIKYRPQTQINEYCAAKYMYVFHCK